VQDRALYEDHPQATVFWPLITAITAI